ncbi:hypothetical protein, partial [Microbacterium sp. 69-10]|uniref:hypothetical protein n=1 Tax=Microbacterium sp. 69-10 TaxID=1895783 RepID=UPI0025F5622C
MSTATASIRQQIPQAWAAALERYELHAGQKVSASTLRIRMGRLRRLASDLGAAPSAVTPEQFDTWAGGLPGSISTAGEYVQAARAFYTWAVRAGVAPESPVPAAVPLAERGKRYGIDDQWADALEGFTNAQTAEGIAQATLRNRLQRVRRFAATINLGPWHVQAEDYGAWIARQEVSDVQRASLRGALRAFYRWAERAGRISEDPTAALTGLTQRLGVPDAWEPEIRAWRRWLIGSGATAATVRTRTEHMEQFARAHRSAGPFALGTDDVFDYMAGHRWARETRRTHRATLRGFYGWAVASGRAATDPTELMPRVKAGEPDRVPATDDEYQAALSAAQDDRWSLALRLACELGMRRSEV